MQISFLFLARAALLLGLLLWAPASSAHPDIFPEASLIPEPRPEPAPVPVSGDTEAPLSTGAWVAHGSLALIPLGGLYGASRLGPERVWTVGAQTGAGMLAGYLPSRLLFLRSQASGPRWMELEVSVFGVGLVLTPPLAALGTWGAGEWLFHGSRDRGDALLGAMGGAAVGTLLGIAAHGLLRQLAGPGLRLEELRRFIALGFIGAGATAGYQWGGRGPRPR
jgi:hypothetical protein